MSRKDYIALANAIGGAKGPLSNPGELVANIIDRVVDVLAADNPNFDEARFRAAIVSASLAA